jgi:photosystem II stability/assembly factor-like uncharacterized protein
MIRRFAALFALALLSTAPLAAAEKKKDEADKPKDPYSADTFAGLELRGIGPAMTSGRIVDIAVDPAHRSTWYVASASGGVWKTANAGTTWTPIFDDQGSYSIGCVALDPQNPLVVWVGSGENNSQRSVSYGDGVYRSNDGGRSWENLGLKDSQHIGKILVDPRDSKTVYVAAQGPLWNPGGDRGLYKTADGGKTWKKVLEISENTGVSDVAFDPRNPDVLYASAYQRRRHVWTLIDGGPESAIYKSTDAGASWKKLTEGLPKGDIGRIGLAVSPVKPDTVYAIVESLGKDSGFYRSTDAGSHWEKRGPHVASSPQYYQEIFADPVDADRVYSMDFMIQVTKDGGKTFSPLGESDKHVDNHALWIDPEDHDHLLNGNDGGLYESFDHAQTWNFKGNLPVAQFYRVAVDDARPFYIVYGGTQDNNSVGGPSRTINQGGIANSDWFVTVGGDGFVTRPDPKDPNILYAESQNGGLMRFDRRTGERVDIQPVPGAADAPLRFNWDSPLVLSPHSSTRLYFGAQKIFRSDDRGDTWRAVSPDLTRQIDRNTLKIMGRVWSVDTVAKNASTSFYGNLVSLSESPLAEGLLYAGADDGLISISENGGGDWRKVESVAGVPQNTYVSALVASRHDGNVVYAAFDNHKQGDFKPYLYRSADRGRTWTAIQSDLPARGTVYAVAEDSKLPNLLYAGTEFGLFFSADGGKKWLQLKGGLPIIAVRDIALQERADDLVIATFGRGFYILDDLAALRAVTPQLVQQEAALLPSRPAEMYIPATPLGVRNKGFLGTSYYLAPNPPFGAVVTYYLKDAIKTRKKTRQEAEKETLKKSDSVAYPSWEALKAEDREEDPAIVLTVADSTGRVVRRLTGPATAGLHRIAWDLRFPPSNPTTLEDEEVGLFEEPARGPLAVPGEYTVSLAKRVDGKITALGESQRISAAPLGLAGLAEVDHAALNAFQQQVATLQRAVLGAQQLASDTADRLGKLRKAVDESPGADNALAADVRALQARLKDIDETLNGDPVKSRRNEATLPGIVGRVSGIVGGSWVATAAPTGTQREQLALAGKLFTPALAALRALVETDLPAVEKRADAAGVPWSPGRLPQWP